MHFVVATTVVVALCAATSGCKAPGCDKAQLSELSARLRQSDASVARKDVWPALKQACAAVLPPETVRAFGDAERERTITLDQAELSPAYRDLITKACPDWRDFVANAKDPDPSSRASYAFQSCNFERYLVVTIADVAGSSWYFESWSTHQLLLDQGLSPEEARPITLALLSRQLAGEANYEPSIDRGLPKGEGLPLQPSHAVVRLTAGTLEIEEQRVSVHDAKGAAEGEAFGRLKELRAVTGQSNASGLVVLADATNSVASLYDLAQTAEAAGFTSVGFAVAHPKGQGRRAQAVETRASAASPDRASIIIQRADAGYELLPCGLDPVRAPIPVPIRVQTLEQAATQANAMASQLPRSVGLEISINIDADLQGLTSLANQAFGRGCFDAERGGCPFSRLVLTEASACAPATQAAPEAGQ